MASKIKVDQIEGSSGSTITVPTGQTLTLTDGLAIGSLPTVTVAKGGTNLTSFTAGDVLYATGSTTLAKLVKGSDDDVLTLASGLPSWAASAGGGKIGQVLQVAKTDTFTTSAGSWTDITDLTLAITPAATSSKILIQASVSNGGIDNFYGAIRFDRGGTPIAIGDASSSALQSTMSADIMSSAAGGAYKVVHTAMVYLDSPSTTSATTYKLQMYSGDSNAAYINRASSTTGTDNENRPISTLTLWEVLA